MIPAALSPSPSLATGNAPSRKSKGVGFAPLRGPCFFLVGAFPDAKGDGDKADGGNKEFRLTAAGGKHAGLRLLGPGGFKDQKEKKMLTIMHIIHNPNNSDQIIQVYGEPENACYEWRITENDGVVLKDTIDDGNAFFTGRQYGNAEIALRDALMVASGMADPFY